MGRLIKIAFVAFALVNLNCQDDRDVAPPVFKYLALGDSYTIGESVAFQYNFPSQLKDSLESNIADSRVDLKIIATTGWTTANLIDEVDGTIFTTDYDLVTLLIGVNNQYMNLPFSIYQSEFPQLVNTAIEKAGGDLSKVIVVSIPDYAFTPFGQSTGNASEISSELLQYNTFASQYCAARGVAFVYITDITQQGMNDTALVASDGLHPSVKAYTKFTERLLPVALAALGR
jgi:acyl-CoA thioesterase I